MSKLLTEQELRKAAGLAIFGGKSLPKNWETDSRLPRVIELIQSQKLASNAELRTWYGDMFQQLINQVGYEQARQLKDSIEVNTKQRERNK